MLNICEIYHIYATYMTDEIVSPYSGHYIVHTCETMLAVIYAVSLNVQCNSFLAAPDSYLASGQI